MASFFRADLHCHSTCSDGSLTPTELVALAIKSGLQGLSITDHDTTNAYQSAQPAAQAAGLLLLNGVEFSTDYHGTSIHVLAYAYSLQAPSIQALCQHHRQRRCERNQLILDRLRQHNIHLSADDIQAQAAPHTMLGRPHIALALVQHGYVATIREAFQRYIGDDAPCYAQGPLVSTADTIDHIHAANGYVVLAHPHLVDGGELIHRLLELPFDGLEAYYGTFQAPDSERWLKVATKHHLFATGGSDFHGAIRPHIALGCSWTPEATFHHLYQRFKDNNPGL